MESIKNEEKKNKKNKLSKDIKISKGVKAIIITFIIFILVGVIGNYHIVLNATDPSKDFVFIKRPYFGFSDILGDIETCTQAPYYSVMMNHPSLCKALQNSGYLESEEERSRRIDREVEESLYNSWDFID